MQSQRAGRLARIRRSLAISVAAVTEVENRDRYNESIMLCPKCGYQQDSGLDCPRCGLVYARYRETQDPFQTKIRRGTDPTRQPAGSFRRFYRVFRWAGLVVAGMAVALILRASPPPQIVLTPDGSQRVENKIVEFQSPSARSARKKLEITESELNGWLSDNLVIGRHPYRASSLQTQDSLISLAQKVTAGSRTRDNSVSEPPPSTILDIKIKLLANALRLYMLFDLHGLDMSMELEGPLSVRNGHLRLDPTSGKLGSFPLPTGALHTVARRLFESPENREKFRVPPGIQDIRIEHGQLVVAYR